MKIKSSTDDFNSSDIDECAINVSICADHPHSHCENTIGNYTCKCDTGYTENGTVSDWTCHGEFSKRSNKG